VKSDLFEIENALLEVLGRTLSVNQLVFLMATIKAFKSLSQDHQRFVVFENNSDSLQKGSFQMGVATEENITLSISVSVFILNTKKNITKFCF